MPAGSIQPSGILPTSFGSDPYDLGRTVWDLSASISADSLPAAGAITDTQPIAEPADALTGSRARSFVDDFYNRMHFSTLVINASNAVVAGSQQYSLTVWNAYLTDQVLNAINPTNAVGITITPPRSLPITFEPLELLEFTAFVSQQGPATIAAAWQFDFASSPDVEVTISGIRTIGWPYRPDGGVLERLEWRTDVLTAFDGTEQRVKLRTSPRRTFEYGVTVSGAERRRLEASLYQWQSRAFAVPVWMDGEILASPLSAGGSSVPVTTASRDYHAGGLAMIVSSSTSFEIVAINSVSESSITLLQPLAASWPAGAEVYPVRVAYMPNEATLSRFTGDTSYGRLRFDVDEANDYAAATETLYRNFPVLELAPNWVEDVSHAFEIKRAVFDPGIGRQFRELESNVPAFVQSHRWLLDGRSQLGDFRAWLYARRGRLSAFWLPTWAQDLELVASVGSSALTLDVSHCSYTDHIVQGIGRRDIRIETNSGAVYYRRVTASTEVSETVERLTIDAALGVLLDPSNVRAISFMALARLDADAAEIAWSRWDLGEAALNIRSLRNDL